MKLTVSHHSKVISQCPPSTVLYVREETTRNAAVIELSVLRSLSIRFCCRATSWLGHNVSSPSPGSRDQDGLLHQVDTIQEKLCPQRTLLVVAETLFGEAAVNELGPLMWPKQMCECIIAGVRRLPFPLRRAERPSLTCLSSQRYSPRSSGITIDITRLLVPRCHSFGSAYYHDDSIGSERTIQETES